MQEGYLDQRLIGQRFIIKPTDLTDGVAFYGILYHCTPQHHCTPAIPLKSRPSVLMV